MTKLEEKLIELGYEKGKKFYVFGGYCYQYSKGYKGSAVIIVNIENGVKIIHHRIEPIADIYTKADINYYEQAYNVMQKDLEELKKV